MSKLNYIDAQQGKNGIVYVWERCPERGRLRKELKVPYYFYTPDENGTFTSIYGHKLVKHEFDNKDSFERAKTRFAHKFESDFKLTERALMDNYYGVPKPNLHTAFIDIEVDYKKELGFSSVENPYAPVNAITIFTPHTDTFVTFAVPPKSWKDKDWDAEIDKTLPTNLVLFETERELLLATLDYIQDMDILSGWNSDFFDIPYLVRRTELTLGKEHTVRWCFEGCRQPTLEEVEKFGRKNTVARLYGRVHLDYMQLFKKFTFEGRASYSLANIAFEELDIEKLDYPGTLEELYNNDFNLFLRYNVRDTEILKFLDIKYKFIDLANQMVHENTVTFDAIFGSVRLIDTGIINYAHYVLKLIVPDRSDKVGDPIEGAMVLSTKTGFYKWIGSVDINSLYPSTMRSINISPEKIVGQFLNKEADWRGIRDGDDLLHICKFEDGMEMEATGSEWKNIFRERKWALSGFGTVFDQSTGIGVIPGLLAQWYSERKKMQAEKKRWVDIAQEKLEKFGPDSNEYKEAKAQEELADLLQLTKKILLNSLYGATINRFCRFYDERFGASTTGTGRQITRHMMETIGELTIGERKSLNRREIVEVKNGVEEISIEYTIDNPNVIAGDTDSTYFLVPANTHEEAVAMGDAIGEAVNSSFPEFMREAFYCTEGFDQLIKAGREVIADTGIFYKKKKYALRVVNLDGKDIRDKDGHLSNKLKTMGLDLKKSDTPVPVQKFLKELTTKVLASEPYETVSKYVNDNRKVLISSDDPLAIAVPKSANKLDSYYMEWKTYEKKGISKVTLPGHIRAAINYNEMLEFFGDLVSLKISSGDKVRLLYLKPNQFGFKSMAFNADSNRVPEWFIENFRIDLELMEEKLMDLKIKPTFDVLGKPVPSPQQDILNSLLEF